MIPYTTLTIIAFAALIHASFQLSISMLMLLSGHAIGGGRRHRALIGLTQSFVWGTGTMTVLLLATIAYIASILWGTHIPGGTWAVVCGLLAGLGVAIWAFYYRSGPGTSLWLPRPLAIYLAKRTKATDNLPEAYSLGLMSILAELLFVIGPLCVAALSMLRLNPHWQLGALLLYALIATGPLLIINALVGRGRSLSRIQSWREHNKRFLQFIAGAGLFVLSAYLYATAVVGERIGGF